MHTCRPIVRSRDDRGEAIAQLVILTPVLILMVFLAIQAALYFHASNVAAAAAASGASAASGYQASAGAGTAAVYETLADLGGDLRGAPSVAMDGERVAVTVTIEVTRIVPFFPESVQRRATEAREVFIGEEER